MRSSSLESAANDLGARVREFSLAVQTSAVRSPRADSRSGSTSRNASPTRPANCTPSACVLARLDHLLTLGNGHAGEVDRDVQVGRYFLTLSDRKVRQCLAALGDNDDAETTRTADVVLGRG